MSACPEVLLVALWVTYSALVTVLKARGRAHRMYNVHVCEVSSYSGGISTKKVGGRALGPP